MNACEVLTGSCDFLDLAARAIKPSSWPGTLARWID
jgi:hypothetical protein